MCGIAGIYSTILSREEKTHLAQKMTRLLAHRGPDGAETYVDDLVAIVMTRLAIVDPRAKDVLIWDEARRRVIALNGEVYNYKALRDSLTGHRFRTATDTEVVLHLYEEEDLAALDQLSGDYAFVIWDRQQRQGLLARDPVGVKPLFVADVAGGIAFASEINVLIGCFPELKQLSPAAIVNYLRHGYVPGPDTVFAGIRKLEPGARLLFGETSAEIAPSMSAVEEQLPASEETLLSGQHLIETAIRLRIPEEVPFGVLLSGGLDSSLMTAIAARQSNEPVHTYSVVFTDRRDDIASSEHAQSRAVAALFGTRHHELCVTVEQFHEAAVRSLCHLGEPLEEPAAIALGLICREARKDVPVLLSGEGADELFAGYWNYTQPAKPEGPYAGMGNRLTPKSLSRLLSPELRREIDNECMQPLRWARELPPAGDERERLEQLLATDQRFWLPDDLLIKADHMSMMSAVETRVPYLDDAVLRFASRLPLELKISGDKGKVVLRRIATRYLPQHLIDQPKRGFTLPLGPWLHGPLRPWVEELLTSLAGRDFFEPEALRDLRKQYFRGRAGDILQSMRRYLRRPALEVERPDQAIWTLVALELFLQRIV